MDLLRKQDICVERAGGRLVSALRDVAILTVLACTATIAAFGQAHGVPPSITSLGSNGIGGGPRPSITSMGPFGWQNPPQSRLGYPRPFPCTVFSSPSQSSTICVNSALPGLPGQVPFFPFGQGAFGQNGLAPGGAGYLFPGGAYGYGRQGPYTGIGSVAVGVPYGYPVAYAEPAPGELVVAAEPSDSQPTAIQNKAISPAVTTNPGGPAPAPAVAGSATAVTTFVPPQKSTVLVLRNGKRLEVGNYAIVGNQVVNMSGSPGRIPLSDLDLNATVQANDDRGVQFSLPTTSRKEAKRDK